ncbi:MAG: cellulose biosynthesis cyclic di-GMP-binding regulatory protein BcsB [Sinimarinibacterium sp.]
MSRRLTVLGGVLVAWAAAMPVFAEPVELSSPAESPALRSRTVGFDEMGWYGPVQLRGVEGVMNLPFGVRLDEVVTEARLHLRYTYSPALIPGLSHLRVLLNNQVVAALPMSREEAGREVETEVAVDPRLFTDFNNLRLDLIGHYSMECEDPTHSGLWASINERSRLELKVRTLKLGDELALLPAPFFDARDNRRLELPMVLPRAATQELLRSAGVVASWFGALAGYRSARFPVSVDELPQRNAVVFVSGGRLPQGLGAQQVPPVEVPTIRVISHPQNPGVKLLLIQGKDDAQLKLAADALVLGQYVISGHTATVTGVDYGQRRGLYDTPNWIRTDRPVRFGELVQYPQDLQASGYVAAPIRISLQVPPDLLTWNRDGVPLNLKYRYTPPVERDNSMLTVSINDQLLKAFHLRPVEKDDQLSRLLVPVFEDELARDESELIIPSLQVGSRNQMQFQFLIEYQRSGWCKGSAYDPSRGAIDADSTLDFSGFAHYAAMPNLALFANAGFPFSKYGDLAETAVLVSPQPQAAEVEDLLFLLGRFGRITGVPAIRYALVNREQINEVGGRDLLVVNGSAETELLAKWRHDPQVVFEQGQRKLTILNPVTGLPMDPMRLEASPAPHGSVRVQADGALAALVGFESPLSPKRTVIALTAARAGGERAVVDALENEGTVSTVRGDTALIRGGKVVSFQSEPVYFVGELSWWNWIWFYVSRVPLGVVLLGMLAGVLFAFWLYGALRRSAARRLSQ